MWEPERGPVRRMLGRDVGEMDSRFVYHSGREVNAMSRSQRTRGTARRRGRALSLLRALDAVGAARAALLVIRVVAVGFPPPAFKGSRG